MNYRFKPTTAPTMNSVTTPERNAVGHMNYRFKRAGVGTNGIIECKFLSKNAHRTGAPPLYAGVLAGVPFGKVDSPAGGITGGGGACGNCTCEGAASDAAASDAAAPVAAAVLSAVACFAVAIFPASAAPAAVVAADALSTVVCFSVAAFAAST
jgi:hypothetical protein